MTADLFVGDLLGEKGPFFKILNTTKRSQTGFMTVPAGQEAGPPETHAGSDQVFYVVDGEAEFRVWDRSDEAVPSSHRGGAGTLVVVPAGVKHWVQSVGSDDLLFLTVYAPPEY